MSVMEDIKELVSELEKEQQMAPINVELLDNELGIVYANSKKAEVSAAVLLTWGQTCVVKIGLFQRVV